MEMKKWFPSNSSYLSNLAIFHIFHFHDYGRKGKASEPPDFGGEWPWYSRGPPVDSYRRYRDAGGLNSPTAVEHCCAASTYSFDVWNWCTQQ